MSTDTPVPTLYVCHGDEDGPKIHPCRRVQEAMHAKGIAYEKVIAGHGIPIPFPAQWLSRRADGGDRGGQAAGAEARRRHRDHALARDPRVGRSTAGRMRR